METNVWHRNKGKKYNFGLWNTARIFSDHLNSDKKKKLAHTYIYTFVYFKSPIKLFESVWNMLFAQRFHLKLWNGPGSLVFS